MNLTSQVHGDSIPKQFTCEGQNISPELSWTDAPKETKSLVLILQDPDAPKQNGFTHWIVNNIPPTISRIGENAIKNTSVIGLGRRGRTTVARLDTSGAVPAPGSHRYFARLCP